MIDVESHLTEHQLEELLMDAAEPATTQHLAGCAHCQHLFAGEHARLASTMDAFNHATLSWAEAKSNTIPRQLTIRPRPDSLRAWSMGAAMVLAVGVAVYTGSHQQPAAAVASIPHATSEERSAEIARDNALLADIDHALDAPIASPSALFELPIPSDPFRQVKN